MQLKINSNKLKFGRLQLGFGVYFFHERGGKMSFNEKLQKLRKDSKMSQEQLADLLAVTRQSVSKWESGQTYPEMDKLLGICKIFNCTLEELTNDSLKVNLNKSEKRNYTTVLLESFLDFINKTYNYFIKITFKDFIKLIFTLFVLVSILGLIKISVSAFFDEFYYAFLDKSKIMNFIVVLVVVVSNVVYYVLGLFIILYIFKIGFLDKKEDLVENDNSEEKVNLEEDNKVKSDKTIKKASLGASKSKVISPLFKFLGSVLMFFVKIGLVFMIIPFAILLVILGFALAVDFYLIFFKGIGFWGVFLLIVFLLLLDILVIEYLYNVLNSKCNNYRRMLITLIVGILGIGLSSGLIMIEVSKLDIVDEAPSAEIIVKDYSYDFNKDMAFIEENYYVDINYVVDNTLKDKVNIELKYYDYLDDVDFVNNSNQFYLSYVYGNVKSKYLLEIVLSNLKENKIYDYSKLKSISVDIITSENNINILKENHEKQWENDANSNDNLCDELRKQNDELRSLIEGKNEEIASLKEEIDSYQSKISEYKNKISSLLE